MSAAVFDSNILIDFSDRNEDAALVLRQYSERYISMVTWTEFLTGVPYPKIAQSKLFLEDMFELVYLDQEIFELTLDIRRTKKLKLPDSIIYATAKYLKLPLVTRDKKDFYADKDDVIVPYQI